LDNGLQMRQAGFKIPHVPVQKRLYFSYLLITFAVMGGEFACLEQERHNTANEDAMHHHRDDAQAE